MQAKYWNLAFILILGVVLAPIYIQISLIKIIQKPSAVIEGKQEGHKKSKTQDTEILWTYDCLERRCIRTLYKSGERTSLKTCNMICDLPQLWPYPKVVDHKNKSLTKYCLEQVYLVQKTSGHIKNKIHAAYTYMYNNMERLVVKSLEQCSSKPVKINIKVQTNDYKLLLNTSEEYSLNITLIEGYIDVTLEAQTYFGARHGLETLYQLIWWDEVDQSLIMLTNVYIFDSPAYPYRGLMLDTGNNYFSVKSIMKTLTGMSINKLNIFHWHITDFASFPFQALSNPNLAKYGAYDETKIYTPQDIRKIVKFANFLGIRVVIEIDAPGHMLAGWEAVEGNMVEFKKNNVTGEMNPNNKQIIAILTKLHEDIIELTGEEELFHIGGHPYQINSEVSGRKNNTETIQTIYDNLKKLNRTKYTILWASDSIHSNSLLFLDPSTTIVQGINKVSKMIKRNGYGVIFSEEPAWSLSCGLGFWSPLKTAGCYQYRTWQNIYLYAPWFRYKVKKIYGGELMLWSEQVGEDTLDNILWPRTAAFAENIWKALNAYEIPPDVFTRLDTQRERLDYLGLDSSVMWPEWCTLNPHRC